MKKVERLAIKKDLIEKRTREGLFMLTSDGRYLFTLNETGTFVWDSLMHSKTRKEIVKDLMSLYDVDENHAQKDVTTLLKEIEKYYSDLLDGQF